MECLIDGLKGADLGDEVIKIQLLFLVVPDETRNTLNRLPSSESCSLPGSSSDQLEGTS